MNIPKKVKVGGITYKVIVTNNIDLGCSACGEIDYANREIRLRPLPIIEEAFLHELIHAMLYMSGKLEHNEEEVEQFAQILLAIIKDNKNIFKED